MEKTVGTIKVEWGVHGRVTEEDVVLVLGSTEYGGGYFKIKFGHYSYYLNSLTESLEEIKEVTIKKFYLDLGQKITVDYDDYIDTILKANKVKSEIIVESLELLLEKGGE